jgi:hypothetical protein
MADYFRKTDRGRREVRERSLRLSRPARNLLLIMDGSRTIGAWVGLCQRATLADGVALLEAGLIEAVPGPTPPETGLAPFPETQPQHTQPVPLTALPPLGGLSDLSARLPPPTQLDMLSQPLPWDSVTRPGSGLPSLDAGGFAPLDARGARAGRLTGLSHDDLLISLNALVRESLGLFRGYRYTVRVERARDVDELEEVARDFVSEVRRLRGDTMARMVQRALGLGG